MSEFQGVVSNVSAFPYNGKNLWSFSLNGTKGFFRCGDTRPRVEKGDYVKFTATTGKNGAYNVDTKSIDAKTGESQATGVKIPAAGTSGASASGVGREDYWVAREARDVSTQKRIEIQSCRNSAIEFLKILLANGEFKLPAKNKVAALEAALQHYIDKFIKENAGESAKDAVAQATDEELLDPQVYS